MCFGTDGPYRALIGTGINLPMTEIAAVKDVRRKGAYHHGELRDALVRATRQLVEERGAENFSLADACRLAGVSTAAPYNHFRDKNEILQELIVQGFDLMTERRRQALTAHPSGSIAGIIAMAQAYIAFAQRETGLFRLMFGQNPNLKTAQIVQEKGEVCFSSVIEDVGVCCAMNRVDGDARTLALNLWTFVHGAASLTIDGDYQKVAPNLDVDRLVAEATPRLLGISK
jgi:AcrR family transcriptional regulator